MYSILCILLLGCRLNNAQPRTLSDIKKGLQDPETRDQYKFAHVAPKWVESANLKEDVKEDEEVEDISSDPFIFQSTR